MSRKLRAHFDFPDVLIAEEDPQQRAALRGVLEGRGFCCAEAEDPQQAVHLARSTQPACLFADLTTAGFDAFALARELRAHPQTAGMHLHGLTSALDAATRAEAQRAGFDMLLTKPVEPSALLDAARRAGWVTDLTKTAAENLLDWLERQGCQHLTVTTSEQGTFGVRFSCPTGLRAKRDPDGGVSLVRVS